MAAIKISPERVQELAERAGRREGEYSRDYAASRIGCSTPRLIAFEREGQIQARKEEGTGRVWLCAKDVEKVAREWVPKKVRRIERVDNRLVESNTRGQIAARCVPLFRQGKSFDEIIVETKIDPIMIADAYRVWRLGIEGILAEQGKKERTEAEREEQRRFDKMNRDEIYRKHQLEMAKLGFSTRAQKVVVPAAAAATNDKGAEEKK